MGALIEVDPHVVIASPLYIIGHSNKHWLWFDDFRPESRARELWKLTWAETFRLFEFCSIFSECENFGAFSQKIVPNWFAVIIQRQPGLSGSFRTKVCPIFFYGRFGGDFKGGFLQSQAA